ncbi:MAG: zinc-dependent metalloprotease [Mycobacteriaceae bacterium]
MSDVPFGFSPGDNDPNSNKRDDSAAGSSGNSGDQPGSSHPFGFSAAGFDPSQIGQMFTQLGQMFTGAASSIAAGRSEGPVNYSIAKQLARGVIGKVAPVPSGTREAITDAVRLAETWLDGVTALPAGVTTTSAWTATEWLDNTIDTWKRLCDPVAKHISGLWSENLPPEAQQMAGPMMGILTQMGGLAFGSQLGQALGQLSKEMLSSTDIGLPLGPQGTAALMPEAIASFSDGLDQPNQEILVFLAAREAAHQRLYSHVPWLRQRVLATVEQYAQGIRIDVSSFDQVAEGFDPMSLTDPAALEKILGQAAFTPQTTPEQKQALERLETLLALVEGWVEVTVSAALGGRIPSAIALSETLRRRRATGGPAEQTFSTLVGLELRPKKVREATTLWARVTDAAGVDARDGVWAHPDLLPDSSDLDNPAAFIDRIVGGGFTGSSFDDPIAELEKTEARERAERAAQSDPTPKNQEGDGTQRSDTE